MDISGNLWTHLNCEVIKYRSSLIDLKCAVFVVFVLPGSVETLGK